MKRVLSFLSLIMICILLASCGSSSLKGEMTSFSNSDGSFSIELPAENEDSWVTDTESPENILSISDKGDTVAIQVQCLSKSQAVYIAADLAAYRDYAMTNLLGDLVTQSDLKESDITVPDFITGKESYEFSLSKGISGIAVFMESPKCYYTYFIMAVDDAFGPNEKVFKESIASLKELTETDSANSSTDNKNADK